MNYKESIVYIESLIPTLERPTLARMKLFMEEQGNRQNDFRCFHVGGTNGKGSTATILETILSSMGLKVGKFTGPHILRFNERFAINGETIGDDEFAKIATSVRQRSDEFAARHEDFGRLTWFEFLTAMAFFYFHANKIDCAVIEVGLGGRFDATNVIENVEASIITNIDLDHMHILGDTVRKIAFEKAGIMRKDVTVITSAVGDALAQLEERAREVHTKLLRVPREEVHGKSACRELFPEQYRDRINRALKNLSLSGPHQRLNAEMAILALLASPLGKNDPSFLDKLPDSLSRVYFPGRMQVVHNNILILDGAHNPAGAKALRLALDERLGQPEQKSVRGYCFILGFFGNKDVTEYLKNLLTTEDFVVAVEAEVRRSTYAKEDIVARCEELGVSSKNSGSMQQALETAKEAARGREIVATGSFAVLKELMTVLGWESVEDGKSFALHSKGG